MQTDWKNGIGEEADKEKCFTPHELAGLVNQMQGEFMLHIIFGKGEEDGTGK